MAQYRRPKRSTLAQEERLDQLANRWLREHALNPLDVTQEEWLQSRTFTEAREKQYLLEHTQYNPYLPDQKFSRIREGWNIKDLNNRFQGKAAAYTRPQVVFDIETDDNNKPIAISAMKFAVNRNTGRLEIIDTYQRYYKSLDRNLANTYNTHGLTHKILNKLRRQQGAGYSWTYNAQEETAFKRFVGDSPLIGHNIQEFDIKHVFKDPRIHNQVIDTLIAARNHYGDNGKNGLAPVFERIFGMTMEQAGLPHHDAMSDTVATAMVYQALLNSQYPVGKALRIMLNHPELNLAPLESNIDGGSQLVKGYYWQTEAKNYIDRYGLNARGAAIMGDRERTLSEIVGENLGTSVQATEKVPRDMGNTDPNKASTSDLSLSIDSLSATISSLERALGVIQEQGRNISGFGNTLSTYKRADWIRMLATEFDTSHDAGYREIAKGLGVPEGDMSAVIAAAKEYSFSKSEAHSYAEDFRDLRKYYKQGMGNVQFVRELRHNLSRYPQWSQVQIDQLDRDQEYANLRKAHYLDKMYQSGRITARQRDNLEDGSLTQSYDELQIATDGVIKKNETLLKTLNAWANIKIYDPVQYLHSVGNQVSGINGATSGVLPSFIRNPMSRFGEAFMNIHESKATTITAFQRAWNSGLGNAITAAGAAIGTAIVPGAGTLIGAGIGAGVKGVVGATSQIYGNVQQAKMERKGLEIQSTLNTLGGINEWLSTPFRLLAKATKILTGSFTGLSLKLRSLMTSGLDAMSRMGNPLTELTGVGYSQYQGATMMDVASLFNRGSMNSVYENFANQAKALYTTGDINTSRLVASSMLGVFDKVYDPNANYQSYNGMVNILLQRMSEQNDVQKAITMYLASLVDSNLPGLLRTANMLGVTDVNELMDPSSRGMFWKPIGDEEASRFRWNQYEYGAFREQFNVSKMRLADTLWNSVGGKKLFNSFNKIVDAAGSGQWQTAFDEVGELWDKLKKKFTSIWSSFDKSVEGTSVVVTKLRSGILTIGQCALEIVRTIINVWDELIARVAEKAEGLVAYLSTITLGVKWGAHGLTFDISSIKDSYESGYKDFLRGRARDNDVINNFLGQMPGNIGRAIGKPLIKDHTSGARLREALVFIANHPELYNSTSRGESIITGNGTIVTGMGKGFDIPGVITDWRPTSEEEVDIVLRALGAMKSSGPGDRSNAALWDLKASYGSMIHGNIAPVNSQLGETIASGLQAIEDTVVNPVIDDLQAELGQKKQQLDINFSVDNRKASTMSVEDGKVVGNPNFTWLSQIFADCADNMIKLSVSDRR